MTIDLSQSQTWSAEVGQAGLEVRVTSGEVWITRERDPEDHVVAAGEAFESGLRGRLAIQALTPARLEVAPLRRAAGLHRERLAHAAAR